MRTIIVLILSGANTIAQKPEPRWLPEITYDASNKQVLMFGGANENGIFSDLWSLKNFVWQKLSDKGPAGGIKSAFAHDASRNCAVLFGGSGEGDKPLGETWEWDGRQWKKIDIAGPPARAHPMAAYDPAGKVVIIFGGFGNTGLLSDTWVYNGKSWIEKDSNGPKNCLPHGIFYDEEKKKMILVTLSATFDANATHVKNEMWEWTGSSWKNLPGAAVYTATGNLQALAPFEGGTIVLYDGDDVSGSIGNTWKFSGNTWSTTRLPGPSARIGEGMVYDRSQNKTILFGGGDRKDVFNDLWQWNGGAWKEMK